MNKILMVPVHLDALYLAQSEPSSEPTADFCRLPYYDSVEKRDVNSDTPWLGDSAASSPFTNSNMTLQKGVHLHWALPDGLCHGEAVKGRLEMPTVPNRWLIRRRPMESGEKEKIWVVESDYLWTPSPPSNQAPAVNVFHKTPEEDRPYRFLGRKFTLKEWQEVNASSHEYLDELTAIGYGESTFAAYYPNCMTVFGFHDRDLLDNTWNTLQYDLIGWYGGGASHPKLLWDKSVKQETLTDSLIEPLRRWRVNGNQEPQLLVCYASIKFNKGDPDPPRSQKTKVAVGNTVSEALSALLANEVAKELNNPSLVGKIEEQLEALHIEDQLTSQVQDLGLRLRQYRHEKSFEPVLGGERWTVHADPPGSERLPADGLTALRHLNDAQAKYSKLMSELEQARRQLYGDWCQYMRCVYRSPDGGRGRFLDIDEIVNYIETRSLAKVEQLKGTVSLAERQLWETRRDLEFRLLLVNIEKLRLNMQELVVYILKLETTQETEELRTKRQIAEKRLDDLILNLNRYNGVIYFVNTVAYLLSYEQSQRTDLGEKAVEEFLQSLTISQISQLVAYLNFEHIKQPSWWDEEDSPAKLEKAKQTLKQVITEIRAGLSRSAISPVLEKPQPSQPYERESLLAEARTQPISKVESPSTLEPPPRPTQYHLQIEPGARFWQPTDPVVLITGGNVQVSDRHGRDGQSSADGMLQCQTRDSNEETLDKAIHGDENRNEILKWIEDQCPSDNERSEACIGFRSVNVAQRPWNPLFLDWGIDMYLAESHAPGAPENYDNDIITSNYQLGSQNPDLQPHNPYINHNPDRFSGRCILGDTPSLILKERIEDVLQRRLIEGKPEFWANPQDPTYLQSVKDWYVHKPTNLPTTSRELKDLVNWYGNRPVKSEEAAGHKLGEAPLTVRAQDPLYCTLCAYQKLFENAVATSNISESSSGEADATNHEPETSNDEVLKPRAFLGQALSGFNGELIQWKLGLSLPIDEPIGLTPYREFSQRVAEAVGDNYAWTTEPTNNFSPIRSGILKLDKLRLIDNFGQVTDIPCDDEVIVPTPYKKGRPGDAFLPPRLLQPACVKFRWLDVEDAVSSEKPVPDTDLQRPVEMVEAEARSPICGWLVPEKLRGQLLVFDGDGSPLGTLAADKDSQTLEWVRAPGFPRFSDDECEVGRKWLQSVSDEYYRSATNGQTAESSRDLGELGASLQNSRLARVLLYLWATRSPKFLECFLKTLDDAMANIDPEGTTSMGSLALLVGRPVAVVGAELDLQLKDKPAIRQDWAAFRLDQYRHDRDTDEFEQVQFRLRLGNYQSRNDAVVGYWLEESGEFAQHTFVAQAADDNDPSRRLELQDGDIPEGGLNARINAHDKGDRVDDLNFTQSVADPPLQATLLMDPRGKAHLTTGILPVKSIDIPRSLWEPAMQAMRLWFPVAPILTRPRSRRVPIPALVDRQWSWLELEPKLGLDRDDLQRVLKNEDLNLEINTLIEQGWLQKQNSVSNRVYLSPRKNLQALANSEVKTKLESIFRRLYLWQTLYPRPSVDRDALHRELFRLNAELGRVPSADYDLILRGPIQGENLIIIKKMQSKEENYYLINVFNEAGKQVVTDEKQKLTDSVLIGELDQVLDPRILSDDQKRELIKKVASYLEYDNAGYDLILRGLQSTDTLPTDGKSLIVARKVKNEDTQYLISIFDGAGYQVTGNQALTEESLIQRLDNKLKQPGLSDYQGRELTQGILMTFYQLRMITDAPSTEGKNLVTAQQVENSEDEQYLINIFDEAGNRVVKDRKLSDPGLVSELNAALETELLNDKKLELLQKIASNLRYGLAELLLRRSQSTDALPVEGKNLVIARQISGNESNRYVVTIFNGTGKQVVINQNLTDQDLVQKLDTVLEFRELGCSITSNLGYTHPDLDRLVEKKWLEEMEPPGDRLYVNPKEDRQSLDDWALETLLDPRLAELSLALVSPGEEVDFNPGIEVREGWLLLQSSDSERKT